ncbi:RDD family protein [Jeotgalibacillus sp. S-D1]|nr:RDD family protein [Jeotgalibacillus sp. S-D1]
MRVWAYLFDVLVIAALNGLLIYPVFRLTGLNEPIGIISVAGIAATLTYFAYFVLMTKFYSQTLGKMVFGLKVVSLKGELLSWPAVLFRELVGRYIHTALTVFTIPLLMILYLVVAFTPKKQGVHDLIADTTVIHERTVLALAKPAIN